MRRREFLGLFGLAAIAWPHAVWAQRREKIPKIGVLWHAGNAEEEAIYLGALRQGFNALGYVEGKTIESENRFAGYDRFDSLATDLVKSKVDVIVASIPLAALTAKRATTTIPIVFAISGDPVSQKLVDSLARPGGNATGFSTMALSYRRILVTEGVRRQRLELAI
jgi:putative ABC transport system substrate-binding protein